MSETTTLAHWKAEVGENFRRVVRGIDGTISTKCGEYGIRKGFGGRIELTPAAADLLVRLIDGECRE